MIYSWDDFVKTLRETPIEFPHLKKVQMAQAILESGHGSSDLFKLYGNPFGMKYRPEMRRIATPVNYNAHDGEDVYCKFDSPEDAVNGYWVFINRDFYSGWRTNVSSAEDYIEFITFAGYIDGDNEAKQSYVNKVTSRFSEASGLLEFPPDKGKSEHIWKKNGVLLEIGHGNLPNGSFDPGASGVSGKNEHELNVIAAKAAQTVIKRAGVPCDVTDVAASLYNTGLRASGYDVFCSIHHNSASNPAQGAEVLVHIDKADSADIELSISMSAEIARELGIRDRINGVPKRRKLGVLSGAEDTDVRVSVLAELYFIHMRVPDAVDWSTRGGQAVGRSILDWLRNS